LPNEDEWAEAPRQAALCEIPELDIQPTASAGRAGVLVHSDASGRSGTIRTFWSTADDKTYAAAMIAEFDLNVPIRSSHSVAAVFDGESAGVCLSEEPSHDFGVPRIGRFRGNTD
jgi:hypothetical protein